MHFGVLADGVDGTGSILNLEVGALCGILGHFDGREYFLDFSFDIFGVDVADYYDALLVGTVPFVVVVDDCLRGEVVHNFHCADRQTFAVFVVRIHNRQQVFQNTHLADVAAAPFLMDHTAFGVDFLGVECKSARPVVENEQAGVLHALAGYGNAGDVVYSLVDRGVGVKVLAELHTYGFQPVDDSFFGEILRTVEAHVLQKVCKTALVVIFEDGTNLLGDVEIGLAFGIFVVADVICQSVVKYTGNNGGV